MDTSEGNTFALFVYLSLNGLSFSLVKGGFAWVEYKFKHWKPEGQ